MSDYYLIFKALHIISVIGFMCAIMYYPRILVNYQKAKTEEAKEILFQMARRLEKYIMTPLAIIYPLFGILTLGANHNLIYAKWWLIKFFISLIIFIVYFYFLYVGKNIKKRQFSDKTLRILNEVPFIVMSVIIFLTVYKPA